MNTTRRGIAVPGDVWVPDRDELIARARALREDLRQDAADADRQRRLTDRAVCGITQAGLMRLLTPVRYGGYSVDMRTLLEVTVELGSGCCSAGWVTGVLNAGNFLVSLYPAQTQDEVWATNPDASAALVLGVPSTAVEEAEGGVFLSGEWGYASGSLHSDWVCVLMAIEKASGEAERYFALMRSSEVKVRDTWFYAGMRGTGSNTVTADGVFVPRHRLLPFAPVLNGEMDGLADESNLYRNSLTGLFSIGLIGPLVGGADAAFSQVQHEAPSRRVAGTTYSSQKESPTIQLKLAAAAVKIDTAKLHARRAADTVDEFARAGKKPDLVVRTRTRVDAAYTAEQCREAIDALLTAYGSSAFKESSPLQRIWRDINVGSRHAGFGMGIPDQLYGRALVGLDPLEISFLV